MPLYTCILCHSQNCLSFLTLLVSLSAVIFVTSFRISQNKLTALLKHFKEHGITPRQKPRWGGRRYNTKALTPQDTDRVVSFLTHVAEDHGLVLAGRIPGFKRSDIRVLPSSMTKVSIWRHYRNLSVARG